MFAHLVDPPLMNSTNKTKLRFRERVRNHLVYTWGFHTIALPVGAFLEVGLAKMSVEQSASARMAAITLGTLGLHYVYKKGNEIFHNLGRDIVSKARRSVGIRKGIEEKTSKRGQLTLDSLYGMGFASTIAQGIYRAINLFSSNDLSQNTINLGTAYQGLASTVVSPVGGVAMDFYAEAHGIKDSPHTPQPIKSLSSREKKMLTYLFTVASLGFTDIIYSNADRLASSLPDIRPYFLSSENQRPSQLEKRVENHFYRHEDSFKNNSPY